MILKKRTAASGGGTLEELVKKAREQKPAAFADSDEELEPKASTSEVQVRARSEKKKKLASLYRQHFCGCLDVGMFVAVSTFQCQL